MTPNWENWPHPPPAAGEGFVMDAVLTPHRSLSQRGFARLLGGFALLNMAISIGFIVSGAYPVVVFLALDVLLLWLAFRMNYKAGLEEERIQVARQYLHVSRRDPRGRFAHWVVSPLWAKVTTDEASVRISSAGKTLLVGGFLSPEEREEFSRALTAAISAAKQPG
jgi:uncharacterized membrane protein